MDDDDGDCVRGTSPVPTGYGPRPGRVWPSGASGVWRYRALGAIPKASWCELLEGGLVRRVEWPEDADGEAFVSGDDLRDGQECYAGPLRLLGASLPADFDGVVHDGGGGD